MSRQREYCCMECGAIFYDKYTDALNEIKCRECLCVGLSIPTNTVVFDIDIVNFKLKEKDMLGTKEVYYSKDHPILKPNVNIECGNYGIVVTSITDVDCYFYSMESGITSSIPFDNFLDGCIKCNSFKKCDSKKYIEGVMGMKKYYCKKCGEYSLGFKDDDNKCRKCGSLDIIEDNPRNIKRISDKLKLGLVKKSKENMRRKIQEMRVIPQRPYRHFKGKLYYVHNVSSDHENASESFVTYQSLYKPYKTYVRPLESFLEEVDINRDDNITKQKYRFELYEGE